MTKLPKKLQEQKSEEVRLAGFFNGNETEFTPTYEDETITYTSEKNKRSILIQQIIDDKVAQETIVDKSWRKLDWLV